MKDKKKSYKSQSDNTENNNSNQKQGEIYNLDIRVKPLERLSKNIF